MRIYVRKFLVNTKGMKVRLKLLDSFAKVLDSFSKVPDCILIVCVCVYLLSTFYLTIGRVTQEETGI